MSKRLMCSALVLAALAAIAAAGCAARCKDCGKTVKVTTLGSVHFDFDRAALKPEGKRVLDEDIKLAKQNRSLDLSIEGHCDIVGSDLYNQQLSERRARAVYDYLLKNGIDAGRMRTVGYGRTKPLLPNDSPANRAKNRRVEIHIIKARP
ncbi:MAG: OmpA family protein [Proteobacteria bacterium]|nr:OmpA family protein [Pseudomonadota bacterium]